MKKPMLLSTFFTAAAALAMGQGSLEAKAVPEPKSLYERVGGIHRIAQFVDYGIEKETQDPLLLQNPRWKAAVEGLNKAAMKFMVTNYLAAKLGGPQTTDVDLPGYVRAFDFTGAQNERAWMLRMEGMTKAGVGMEEQEEIRKWFDAESMKAKPVMPTREKFMKPDSLYARLGGVTAISAVVDAFVNQLATDPTIVRNPHVAKSLMEGKVSAAGLKYLVTEQLSEAAGGPYKYSGRSMVESHKGLMISEKEWEAGAGILKRVLDMFKVPAKEQGEIFAAISATRRDIVGG